MYHIIALYKNTWYYFGCACNHGAAIGAFDVYKTQFPGITNLEIRVYHLKGMLEYIQDFHSYDVFEAMYKRDNV